MKNQVSIIFLSSFIITGILLFFGCKHEVMEKPVPVILISTPSNNQNFVMGDTVYITGSVTHALALIEVAVHMTDLSDNVEFFHNNFSAGNSTTFNFNSKYPIPNNIKSSFEVEVEAKDIDGNEATQKVTIRIN